MVAFSSHCMFICLTLILGTQSAFLQSSSPPAGTLAAKDDRKGAPKRVFRKPHILNVTQTSVKLTWYSPVQDLGNVTNYSVYVIDRGVLAPSIAWSSSDPTKRVCEIHGLTPDSAYAFQVTATCSNSSDKQWVYPRSNRVRTSLDSPGPPTGLQYLRTTPFNITLQWEPPAHTTHVGIASYIIYAYYNQTEYFKLGVGIEHYSAMRYSHDWYFHSQVTSDQTSVVVGAMYPGSRYYWKVVASTGFNVSLAGASTASNIVAGPYLPALPLKPVMFKVAALDQVGCFSAVTWQEGYWNGHLRVKKYMLYERTKGAGENDVWSDWNWRSNISAPQDGPFDQMGRYEKEITTKVFMMASLVPNASKMDMEGSLVTYSSQLSVAAVTHATSILLPDGASETVDIEAHTSPKSTEGSILKVAGGWVLLGSSENFTATDRNSNTTDSANSSIVDTHANFKHLARDMEVGYLQYSERVAIGWNLNGGVDPNDLNNYDNIVMFVQSKDQQSGKKTLDFGDSESCTSSAIPIECVKGKCKSLPATMYVGYQQSPGCSGAYGLMFSHQDTSIACGANIAKADVTALLIRQGTQGGATTCTESKDVSGQRFTPASISMYALALK